MVMTNAARTGVLSRMSLARTTPRVASPALVIGLGSTACQITRQLEDNTAGWSQNDKNSIGFVYLDTREATRDEVSRGSQFIPLDSDKIGCTI